MKFVIALVFAFALTANASLLKRPAGSQPIDLAEITKHPLGQSLMSLAQLHAKDNSVAKIIPLLNEIKDDLTNDFASNEAEHEKNVKYCNDESTRLNSEIDAQEKRLANAQNAKKTAEENLAILRPRLQAIVDELARDEKELADGNALREKQHNTYLSDKKQNQDAIVACKEADAILQSLLGGSSFIQLKDRFAKVTQSLQATKPASHAHIYAPIIRALAQITTKADPAAIKKIIELIDNLRQQLEAALGTIEQDEAAQAASWAKRKATLESEITQGKADKAATEKSIKQNEDALEQAISTIAAATKELASLKRQLENLLADCAAKQAAYEKARDQITAELAIINAMIKHFEANNAKLNDFINNAPKF